MKDAAALDADDALGYLRGRFQLPADTVYLDGNSLGVLPAAVPARLAQLLRDEWGQDLISSWNRHDWIGMPIAVGEKIAGLLGAGPGQVICCDSISVNLFKLLTTALQLRPGRTVILSEEGNFPTDLYLTQGISDLLGTARCSVRSVPPEELISAMAEDVAVLMLTQVNFRDGSLHDMQALTRAAHDRGILVLWDLAHSAGVLPIELDAWQVDMAVGCGYKFLNGGPGAPAFVYLASRHQNQVAQPLCGWLGHAQPFAFEPGYRPAAGVQRYRAGTPGILGMAALDTALDCFAGVSMTALRAKSLALSGYFINGLQEELHGGVLRLLTPRDASRRGSQVALSHPHAWGVSQALIAAGVIVDFREPDVVRFGFAPLYNSFSDVAYALGRLRHILATEAYRDARFSERPRVT
tara:strand:+ start:51687 stop:52916 length:1230 start_codon:yes stop_codon:yes gene_type:complete